MITLLSQTNKHNSIQYILILVTFGQEVLSTTFLMILSSVAFIQEMHADMPCESHLLDFSLMIIFLGTSNECQPQISGSSNSHNTSSPSLNHRFRPDDEASNPLESEVVFHRNKKVQSTISKINQSLNFSCQCYNILDSAFIKLKLHGALPLLFIECSEILKNLKIS